MSRADSVEPESLRAALGQFATGVTVVTTRDGQGTCHGMTVNSFTSVSLDPPLVLYCLGKDSFDFRAFAEAETFVVNVLASDQRALSDRFALAVADPYPDLAAIAWSTGSPVLKESLAAFDCARESVHDAGDHLIMVGRVKRFAVLRETEPLVYFRGRYRRLDGAGS